MKVSLSPPQKKHRNRDAFFVLLGIVDLNFRDGYRRERFELSRNFFIIRYCNIKNFLL